MRQIRKDARLDSFDGPEGSAVYCISSPSRDRDFDFVRLSMKSFKEWADAGAPWHVGHRSDGLAVASSIGPDGKLHVWEKGGKWYARAFFDLGDPESARVYRAVKTGRGGASSVAFIPHRWQDNPDGRGKTFPDVSISEVSITTVPSNQEAVLQEIKSLEKRAADWRVQKWRTEADIEGPGLPGRNPNPRSDGIGDDDLHGTAREEVIDRYHQRDPDLSREHDGMEADDDQELAEKLAALYSHAKSEGEYLDRLGMKGLAGYKCRHVDDRLAQIKETFERECPGESLEQWVTKFEQDADGGGMETGEAGLVDAGHVPEEEEEEQPDKCCGRKVGAAAERKLLETERKTYRWLAEEKLLETEYVLAAHDYM